MKRTLYIAASLLALAACSKNAAPADLVEWSFEAVATKAAISDAGVFSWSAGDQIKIWDNTTSAFVTFTDKVGKGVYTAEAPRTSVFSTAIYPASVAAGTTSVTLPATYSADEAAAGKTFPMVAEVNASNNTLSFKHAAALLRFTIAGVSEEMTQLTVTATGKNISGTFSLAGSPAVIAATDGAAGVTIPLSLTGTSNVEVTLPMPAGSYAYSIKVGTAAAPELFQASTGAAAQTFERAKIYKLGNLDFYLNDILLESDVKGEDFTVEQDNPYNWN